MGRNIWEREFVSQVKVTDLLWSASLVTCALERSPNFRPIGNLTPETALRVHIKQVANLSYANALRLSNM
ncbi:hypothetical protein WAI453_002972 [Rhynchosporium graminicola]